MKRTFLSLFCGIGGLSKGFVDEGFECVAALDSDPEACRDHEMITGDPATPVDIGAMEPVQLRWLCNHRRPDVVCTSPPCKSFSGCLPKATATTPKYEALSTLAYRGIWLVLRAFHDDPPPLIVMENVPRIQTRGREWLDDVTELLESYGYAVRETTHDCGEIGHLAQSRKRFLMVARHRKKTPQYLYVPPKYDLRSIGDVFRHLPVPIPGCDAGGPMHRLTRLSALNWARLALIPAGGDWRDIPEAVGLTCSPRATAYGVESWKDVAGTVVGAANHDNGAWTVADPRITTPKGRRDGSMGVTGWREPSTTVIANGTHHNGPWQVADHRLAEPTHFVAETAEGMPAIVGPDLDLESRRSADPVPIIRAADGTWHRPMTTLELAALQGFPTKIDGEWLHLSGGSKKRWRQRIGNAVPPPAGAAIAKECGEVLQAAEDGSYRLRGEPVWVDGVRKVAQ